MQTMTASASPRTAGSFEAERVFLLTNGARLRRGDSPMNDSPELSKRTLPDPVVAGDPIARSANSSTRGRPEHSRSQ